MGQKVHPTGIRLGIVKDHSSVWYSGGKDYADKLNQDLIVRNIIKKRLANASVSKVDIERPAGSARVVIHSARPGIVIGRKGEDVERLRTEIQKVMQCSVNINIEEIRKPDLDATLASQNVAQQLEKTSNVPAGHEKSRSECNEIWSSGRKDTGKWKTWWCGDCEV